METDNQLCPVCEKGELISKTMTETFCYKGIAFTLADVEYSECPNGKAELTKSA